MNCGVRRMADRGAVEVAAYAGWGSEASLPQVVGDGGEAGCSRRVDKGGERSKKERRWVGPR